VVSTKLERWEWKRRNGMVNAQSIYPKQLMLFLNGGANSPYDFNERLFHVDDVCTRDL